MTKKYNTPMLQVVSIKNNVIATSGEGVTSGASLGNMFNSDDVSYAPDRNSWDAGF